MTPSAENDVPPEDTLADLIDQWWENDAQPTMHHDGIEYLASWELARFLVANGYTRVPPPWPALAIAWEAGVDAAFQGAVARQNADDVKRGNPYVEAPRLCEPRGTRYVPGDVR